VFMVILCPGPEVALRAIPVFVFPADPAPASIAGHPSVGRSKFSYELFML